LDESASASTYTVSLLWKIPWPLLIPANYYVRDSVKISLTINPATGYPQTIASSAQLFCKRLYLTADAYATALMVMGLGVQSGGLYTPVN
jgi:hypothetical protein